MEHKEHHKRELRFLIAFILTFFFIFMVALANLIRGVSLLGLGFSPVIENWILIILSLFSIVKVLFNIIIRYFTIISNNINNLK